MKTTLICLLVALAASVSAQQPVPATAKSQFAFDQDAPDLASVQGYTFRLYIDGSATGAVLPVTCTGAAIPFQCAGPIPAFTPGTHTVTVSASNEAGESDKSEALTFRMVIVPGKPTTLRIQP